MTITTTSLGSYTTQVSLNGETSSAAFITALDAAIITGSYWSAFDVSNQYYRVYRSLNIDGVSYKYAVVSIDPWKQKLWLSTYESWDATAHIGVNEVFTSNGGYWQGYTFNQCDVVVFAGPRWLGLLSYIRSSPMNNPAFVVETTRENASDTAANGYPCWGFMTPSALIQTNSAGSTSGNTTFFSVPRSRDGYTGKNAAQKSVILTSFARINSNPNTLTGFTATALPTLGVASAFLQNTNAWDSNSTYAYTMRLAHNQTSYQGKITTFKGAKVTGGTLLSKVTLNVDSNFFYSNSGTAIDHFVIPINKEQLTTANLTNTVYTLSSVSYGTVGDILWNGTSLLFGSSTGVHRYNIDTAILTTTAAPGTKTSICFDGKTMWFLDVGANRIIRWDTTTDAVSTGATISGMSAKRMCYDGAYLWALDNSQVSSTITVRKIDPTTLTQVAAITTSATSGTTQVGVDIAADVFGNIAFTVYDGTVASNFRIYKIAAVSGTITGFASPTGAGLQSYQALSWNGNKSTFTWFSTAPASSARFYNFYDLTGATPTILATTTTTNAPAVGVAPLLNQTNYVVANQIGHQLIASGSNGAFSEDIDYAIATDQTGNFGVTNATAMYNSGTHAIFVTANYFFIYPISPSTATGAHLLLPK